MILFMATAILDSQNNLTSKQSRGKEFKSIQ